MSYNILNIEGIGPTYAEKLKAYGLKTTDDLLEMGGTKKGREKIPGLDDFDSESVLRFP